VETIFLVLEFRGFNRMRIFMRIFEVIKEVQPTSDDMREYFECSLRMKVELEEVRREFIIKVVDIRFS
jgi:hypothetical protein